MDNNKIRMAMVGGGEGAFIGAIHRIAARLDGQIELVAGVFSRYPKKCLSTGQQLGLDPSRCYHDYETLFREEAQLPQSQRMQFVAIVTPNHLHFPIASAAIKYGFHVLSDKPATLTLAQALMLQNQLSDTHCLYGLTQTYTGYPMVKEARHRIATGALGTVKKIVVEYSQGWLANTNDETSKQASWRLDAKKSGISCCMGDIGVHAANLAEYVSGLEVNALCADLNTVVAGRTLDDDGTVLLRFNNGAKGVLMASQIAVGEENNLKLRIYGEKASIEWAQMEPNNLWLREQNAPAQLIRTGVGNLCPAASKATRTPAGHPEGYLEAFANIYLNFAEMIQAHCQNNAVQNQDFDVPGIKEAVRGMAFIENAVVASAQDTKWHPFTIG
ncbi:hypothetical protein PSECIP111951_02083 [Pseudoalteromonas holothuriae]|uniref:Oxidoreductase n=1 Tax=Pseudoalteromonas holothuriae TaxID=2963714 RepID=A0A9W4QRV7_9GAMM|nr:MULTISPECIES: Gfo/Idh/MocA family oxidoreductase [unclassified Pseudoalteromonas]CAH9050505.1 hypothetical protein PSECIP111854_00544 [Pseudoalteromonas sp. CIP111854]CAH9059498.1 hypothetical protein PSECIP111951_02083 [Pseudoalteromonas sp. CIP111951]